MKNKLLTVAFLFALGHAFANTYYVGTVGVSAPFNGLSPAHAWTSIKMLVDSMSSTRVIAGDSVLFNRGETFYGSIVPRNAGASGNPIVFDAYGTGAKPIISGFTTVTGWVNIGTNLWEAPTTGVSVNVNLVMRNSIIQQIGRFPNAGTANGGYIRLDTATGTWLEGGALAATKNWTGAEVAIRNARWEIRRRRVVSHTDGTGVKAGTGTVGRITFTSISQVPKNNYGYFFQRDSTTLDVDGEWYQNGNKLRMYLTTNPASQIIQVATVDTLFKDMGKSNITVSNLAFTGSDKCAVMFNNGSGYNATNVDVYNNGGEGITSMFATNVNFTNCTSNNSLSSGIKTYGVTTAPVFLSVINCTVSNTNLIVGMEQTDVASSRCGIFMRGGDNITMTHNSVTNSGYNALTWVGTSNNVLINKNFVNNYCITLDDGGGIYAFTASGNTLVNGTNRIIEDNILVNGVGNANGGGAAPPSANGIYNDEGTRGVIMRRNTLINISYNGFQGNCNSDLSLLDNTVFNANVAMAFQRISNETLYPMTGFMSKRNIFYPFRWWFRDQARNLPTNTYISSEANLIRFTNARADIDSNYYSTKTGVDTSLQLQTDSVKAAPSSVSGFLQIFRPITYLKASNVGYEVHSVKVLDNTGIIEYNASDVDRVVAFAGLSKKDVYGNIYNNSVTIAPWSSKILLSNGTTGSLNFYICATGDNTTGLDSAHAWHDIAKLNANIGSVTAGTTIFFHKGETFTGSVALTNTGTSTSGITISSFGTGAKPIISGLTTLTGWVNVGGNIWQSTPSVQLKKNVNILTINGVPQAVGRTDWIAFTSSTPTVLTSSAIASAPSYVGAQICIRKNGNIAERGTITAQTGTTVTFTNNTQPIDNNTSAAFINGTANYGFFAQRFAGSLDQQGEWYFDSVANKMNLYSTVNPSTLTVKTSFVDTLLLLSNKSYVTVTGVAIEGAGMYGVESVSGSNININNCDFTNNTKAVYAWNVADTKVEDNTFNYSLNGAVLVNNPAAKRIDVNRNVITNTGLLFGNGVFNSEYSLVGIVAKTDSTRASNFVNIVGNTVKASGSSGINFQGSNVTVRRNVVDTALTVVDAIGAVETVIQNTSLNGILYSNRTVDSNFVSNVLTGAALGAPVGHIDAAGVGLNDQTNVLTLNHNVIWNIRGDGIRLNTANAITITDNLLYNNTTAIGITRKQFGDIRNLLIKKNIFFAKTAGELLMRFNSGTANDIPMFGVADTNYYARPIDDNLVIQTTSPAVGTVTRDLQGWQLFTSQDLHSKKSPKTITNVNELHFNTNPTGSATTLNFTGFSREDVTGVIYVNTAPLPAWSGKVLMDTLAVAPNQLPVVNAGADVTLTLPASGTSVTGTASDPGGSITSVAWTQTSGPTTASMGSPNALTTTIAGLTIQGTYTFKLSAVGSGGASDTASDFMQIVVNPAVVPPNNPPVAVVSGDQTITLPNNSVTVSGVGSTDSDGSIVSYAWVKISGPTSGGISSPSSITTTITGLVAGVYVFQLTVTDNGSPAKTGRATVQITVNPDNIAPTANAGADINITSPTSSVTVNGSGTDQDGVISSYSWAQISGPSGAVITTPTSAITTITGLTPGTYVYELTVTDNGSPAKTGKDAMQIVASPANIAPTANAGTQQVVTLPVNSTTLNGSGVDQDGTIASYAWSKISGPTGGAITASNAASTAITGLQAGTYVYQLIVTDNNGAPSSPSTVQIIVNAAPPPVPPTANAGNDTTITLPDNSVNLSGSATLGSGTSITYLWTELSGANAATILTPASAATNVTGLIAGQYDFRLKVTNNLGDTSVDVVHVTVLPAIPPANNPPVANAGSNQTITLPVSSVNLSASLSTDSDGSITGYSWVQTSGPSAGVFGTPNAVTTTFGSLIAGTYTVKVTVTDNIGATSFSSVTITVNAAIPNIPPQANAGTDVGMVLPTNSTTLHGSGTDQDGTITGYLWTKLPSSPSGGAISTPTSANTLITGLVQGTYFYQLRVTDNSGDTATAVVKVTVSAANVKPTASAGTSVIITLPVNSTTLTGSGADVDGTIVAYLWTKLPGSPSGGTITTPTAASTGITGLVQGVYNYQLRVTDNAGDTATAFVSVTVNAANIKPVAHAGEDQTITLPLDNVVLLGSGTDADGFIVEYQWTKISGPIPGGFPVTPDQPTSDISGFRAGFYIYQLRVKDNSGDTATDVVQITILPAPPNQHPTAVVASSALTVRLPVNSVTVDGSGSSDADGSIVNYTWTKISGPTSGTITDPNAAITTFTGLVQGTYQFKLRVLDNVGDSGTAFVQVTVLAAFVSPLANVGADQTLTLPTSTTTIAGTGTAFGGATIVSYLWQDVAGNPTTGTIQSPTLQSTTVLGLIEGVYHYSLTVTDSNGKTGTSVITVTVQPIPPPDIPVLLRWRPTF